MKLGRRVGRLERPLPGGRLPGWARALAAEVAVDAGLDPAAVVREAEALLAEAARAGVLGDPAGFAHFLAAAGGGEPAAILAVGERLARWRG